MNNLVASSNTHMKDWMHRKARLADGTIPNLPVLPIAMIQAALAAYHPKSNPKEDRTVSYRDMALVGLGRDLGGIGFDELAKHFSTSRQTLIRRYAYHRAATLNDPAYADWVALLAKEGLRCWRASG
ncbi:MAG: hypothetical protein R3F17_11360 [Planctomycetota bacterium]